MAQSTFSSILLNQFTHSIFQVPFRKEDTFGSSLSFLVISIHGTLLVFTNSWRTITSVAFAIAFTCYFSFRARIPCFGNKGQNELSCHGHRPTHCSNSLSFTVERIERKPLSRFLDCVIQFVFDLLLVQLIEPLAKLHRYFIRLFRSESDIVTRRIRARYRKSLKGWRKCIDEIERSSSLLPGCLHAW